MISQKNMGRKILASSIDNNAAMAEKMSVKLHMNFENSVLGTDSLVQDHRDRFFFQNPQGQVLRSY